jgi:hypothetical protein
MPSKSLNFVQRDHLDGTCESEDHFGAKKVEGSLGNRDFVQRDHFDP